MKREKSSDSIKTKVIGKTKSVSRSAASIPNGKYLTVTQVAEICGVREKTVSAWLKKGLLKGINLPGLGQIVEEKDLEKYLAEKQTDPEFAKYKHVLITRVSIQSFYNLHFYSCK